MEWLLAQLDEDDRIARAAGGRSEQVWEADLSGKDPLGLPSWPVAVRYVTDGGMRGAVANLPVMQERSEDRMVHIAEHDPARVLREIDAKRRTLIRCQEAMLAANPMLVHFAQQTVREMALPYTDRSGYPEEWRQ
jgi:hypothetical protein